MKKKYILFDLDGTIIDSKKGIINAILYANEKMEQFNISDEVLTSFIGPPLLESFMSHFNYTVEEGQKAIEHYRVYFKDKGVNECHLYPGIDDMLKRLYKDGYKLAIATSKPTVFAKKILEGFGVDQYFECINGSFLDGRRSLKSEVIESVIDDLSIEDKKTMVMIGDREHDIIGAKTHDILSIGVRYGFALEDELESAQADVIVENVSDLYECIKNG